MGGSDVWLFFGWLGEVAVVIKWHLRGWVVVVAVDSGWLGGGGGGGGW